MRKIHIILYLILFIASSSFAQNKHKIIAQIGDENQPYQERISSAYSFENHIFITGNFSYSSYIKEKSNSFISSNKDDIFIARLDLQGNPIWQKAFGSTGLDMAFAITADDDGNSYASGCYSADFTFEGKSFTGNDKLSAYVMKLDNSGNLLWAKSYSANSDIVVTSLITDENKNVYVCGWTYGSDIVIEGATYINSGKNAFIIKYTPGGELIWIRMLNNAERFYISALALTKSGIIIGGGIGKGKLVFNENEVVETQTPSCFFYASVDSNGNLTWINRAESGPRATISDIHYISDSVIYVTGIFSDSLKIDNVKAKTVLQNSQWGDDDNFLMKVNSGGKVYWYKTFGTLSPENYSYIEYSGEEIMYVMEYTGNITVNGKALKANESDLLALKIDSEGLIQGMFSTKSQSEGVWVSTISVTDIIQDNNLNFYITGVISYKTSFGDTLLFHRNSHDGFIWKLDNEALSVKENSKQAFVEILYPNPTQNILFVKNNGNLNNARVEILFTDGKIVKSYTEQQIKNGLDVSDLKSGIYFVRYFNQDKFQTTKFIKL